MPRSSRRSLPSGLPAKILWAFIFAPRVPHAPPGSSSLIWSTKYYMATNTNHEALSQAISFCLLLLPQFSNQVPFSTFILNTLCLCSSFTVRHQVSSPRQTTVKISYVNFDPYVFSQQMSRHYILKHKAAVSLSDIILLVIFPSMKCVSVVPIYIWLQRIFQGFISHPYVYIMIVYDIL
jgi:hypothetical protein